MPTSKTTIGNRALTKLGEARVLDFSDDNKQARALTAVYDTVLDSELAAYLWSFAMTRASLPALTAPPAFGYQRAYQLPADFLRLVMAGEFYVASDLTDYRGGPSQLYVIESGMILTDLPAPLKIRYLRRVTDPMQYSAPFVEALACRLAEELCEDLTQSSTKRQMAEQAHARALAEARRLGAIERIPERLPDSEWVTGRL